MVRIVPESLALAAWSRRNFGLGDRSVDALTRLQRARGKEYQQLEVVGETAVEPREEDLRNQKMSALQTVQAASGWKCIPRGSHEGP